VWSYRFFLELVTTGGLEPLHAAVADVEQLGGRVILLGSFPDRQ
jgi:prephenate dehydratase